MFRFSAVVPVAAALVCAAPQFAYAQTLKVGSPAPMIKVAKFVKGEPTNMEKSGESYKIKPGTVHVVEFWATWCGPCKVSIPHLTELANKYKGKVTMTGVSISEEGDSYVSNVSKFVTEMGPKMDYNVAVDDKAQGGFMSTSWMEAAGQDGIPTAFIIGKDNKVAWIGHPMGMDKPLEEIVAGTWDAKKYASEMDKEQAVKKAQEAEIERLKPQIAEIAKLAQAGRVKEAIEKLDAVKTEDPQLKQQLAMFKLNLMRSDDEAAAAAYAKTLADGMFKGNAMVLNSLAWEMVGEDSEWMKPDYDVALYIAQKAVEASKEQDPSIMDTLSMAYYRKGDLDKAIANQEKAIALLDKINADERTRKELNDRLARLKQKKAGN